jgi:hypothetical protein
VLRLALPAFGIAAASDGPISCRDAAACGSVAHIMLVSLALGCPCMCMCMCMQHARQRHASPSVLAVKTPHRGHLGASSHHVLTLPSLTDILGFVTWPSKSVVTDVEALQRRRGRGMRCSVHLILPAGGRDGCAPLIAGACA